MDSNQYAIELVTYVLVLVVYFYELIVYMLLERNAFDSIAFFPQCTFRRPCTLCQCLAFGARPSFQTTSQRPMPHAIFCSRYTCANGVNIISSFKKSDIFLWKKRCFQMHRDSHLGLSIAVDCFNQLSYAGVRHLLLHRKTSLYRLVALPYGCK